MMERLTFSSKLELDKFKRIWESWIELLIDLSCQLGQTLFDIVWKLKNPLVHSYRF